MQAPAVTRTVSEVAAEIRRLWPRMSPAARPYLDAMVEMHYSSFAHPDHPDLERTYGADPARDVVERFLCNASGFRGPRAREIKDELRRLTAA